MKIMGILESYSANSVAGNTKARNGWGLGPLMVADPRKVRQPPRMAKEVAEPKKEERGERKGDGVGGGDGVDGGVIWLWMWILMEKEKKSEGDNDKGDVVV